MIVFYDGVCGLCNGFVKFVVRRDRNAAFHYAPLQGETADRERAKHASFPTLLETVVVVDGERVFTRSTAVIRVCRLLPAPWSWLANLARVIPRPLRDLLYSIVAKNRYRTFGMYDVCPLPPADARSRFLP